MMALLAHLRSRPWLGGCFIVVGVGISVLMRSRYGHILFWAGIASIVGGLLMALSGEIGYRRERAGHREEP
jgi:hypothetical protein